MSRKRASTGLNEGVATGAPVRSPRPAPQPILDARLLMLAAVIASPAVYRSTQGLLSPTAAFERFGIIAVGCVVLSGVVRTLWAMVRGESAPAELRALVGAAPLGAVDPLAVDRYDDLDLGAASPLSGVALPPVGRGLDLLEDVGDPADLLRLGD
jgi:hypothetical protein